ncbi:ABC transporter substrate-binding protein [Blautia sp. MSJ-19]|uniref:ABC transporter substrate-binding protein n=1 Tax=Blautia sp. MSJ-19 TaxID=2841517 RepID=UPI001C0F0731|nr:extracellular solute-binding protein [Blautia sp. MSJ-19]MBU5482010.1 extracellular solute-binding protein [Blautia sp. MSJ-19]
MSNMKKRISVIMAAAMAMSLAAVPVHAESNDQVTLSFWSWLPTTDQSEEMIAVFEEQNPDIKIEYTRTEQDDYFEKLQVAMASGTGPDLFGLTTGAMKEQYAPFAEDMNGLADEYWAEWKDTISDTAVEQCTTEDGTVVGMPLLVAGMTDLLYNKTLMDECGIEKVPTTYEELKDAAAKAKEHGYVCVAAGAADDWVNSDWFVQISNEFEEGAVYEAEKGERSWTDQCFVDTMTAWQNLFNDGIFEDGALGVATYPDARDQYFFARKSVFFLTGSWHLGPTSPTNSEIQGTEIANQNDTIGMCVFPSMTEDGTICGTSGVDIMMAVNKDCEEKEAAMKFVEFMANGDGQQYWVNQLQGAPVSKNISYTGTVDGDLQQQSIDEVNSYVSNAVGNRKLSNSEVETAIQVAMQNVAAGADPAEELQTVQDVQDAQ